MGGKTGRTINRLCKRSFRTEKRNWESWPKAGNKKDGLKVLGNSGRQKCSRQQIGG